MVLVLLVDEVLLQSRVSQSHQVVQTAGSLDDGGHCFRPLSHGGQQAPEPIGKDAKGILHDPASSGEAVVEDPLFIGHVTLAVGLHQPGFQGKGVITNQEVGGVLVVSGKGVWRGESNAAIFKGFFQLALVEDLCIRCAALAAHFHPQKLVICVNQGHQDNRVEALVVEVG